MVTRIKDSRADRRSTVAGVIVALLLLLLYVYPLYFIIIVSVSDPFAVWNGRVTIVPVGLTLMGYEEMFAYPTFLHSYLNSIFYTGFGVLTSLAFTLSGAYALSRKEFLPGPIIMRLLVFTMYFSGGLIPTYMLIRGMGMLNTVWAILIPGIVSVTNLIITRTYIATSISGELREAAMLDGCGDTRYFLQIVLPLSKAIIAVMALYYGVSRWNAYFDALIYLNDRKLYPLQLILRELLNRSLADVEGADEAERMNQMRLAEVVKYCAIVISSLPPMLLYPLVQKFFVKGVMIGSIKG